MTLGPVLLALVEHGPRLALGATVLLLLAAIGLRLPPQPAWRRNCGAATTAGLMVFLLAALVPLPRWSWSTTAAAAEPAPLQPTTTAAEPTANGQRALAGLDRRPAAADQARATPSPAARDTATATVASPTEGAADLTFPTPPATPRPWPEWLASTFLLGAAAMLLRLLLGFARLLRLRRRASRLPAALLRSFDLPEHLRVFTTSADVRPFCAGLWRPFIVVPATLLTSSQRAHLAAVLRHEAAHVHAGDPRLCALLSLLMVPLFWHPLFWWFCRELRFTTELLADDRAVAPSERPAYARHLLALAESPPHRRAPTGTLAVFHRRSEFFRRMHMLLQRRSTLSAPTRARRATTTVAALLLAFTSATVCGVPLRAQEPTPREQSLADQNAQLRAELDALRAELEAVRAARSAPEAKNTLLPSARPTAPTATREPSVEDLSDLSQLLASRNARPAPTIDHQSAEAIADLVTRSIDLDAEIAAARDDCGELKELAAAGTVSAREARRAESRLRALLQKKEVVVRLVAGERKATEAELRALEARMKEAKGDRAGHLQLEADRERTEARLEALRTVQ